MNPIKTILLAVDFTDHSKLTLQSAISYCKENNCSLSIIHIIEKPGDYSETERNQLEHQVDEIAKVVQNHNITVPHVKVASGNIEENVVFFSESIQADAIFLGAGNFHKNKKYHLGYHAEAILRMSSIPVLIIKKNPNTFKGKIACLIDLTIQANKVLTTAIAYARQSNSELTIIHSIESPVYGFAGSGFNYSTSSQKILTDRSKELDDFLKQFDLNGVSWSIKLLVGPPAIEATNFIKSQPFTMTIIGTTSRAGISRFILGSVAETVVRNIDCPCLVIKEKDDFGEIIIL